MFRDVPGCSGMFRDVLCSGFYRRPRLNQFCTAVLVWCGKSVNSVELFSNVTWVRHTVRRLNQISRQRRSKVELILLGSAHEKYGV